MVSINVDVSHLTFQDAEHMSFQRILETSRRLGTPLIVTDAAGREPMVVMPLQAYERLSEGGSRSEGRKSQKTTIVDEPRRVEIPVERVETKEVQNTPDLLEEISIKVMETQDLPVDSEISMEERFYLEPMEGQENSSA